MDRLDLSKSFYSGIPTFRPGVLTKGATLTIKSVHKEDIDRTFICLLASAQQDYPLTYKKVRIFKKGNIVL